MKLTYFIALVLLALLNGCAAYAAPNFLNGRYYLAGDDDCKYMRPLSDTRIMCQDSSRLDACRTKGDSNDQQRSRT